MPRGGAKPGERRGGRQKGSLNKSTIARIVEKETGAPPPEPPVPAQARRVLNVLDELEVVAKFFLLQAALGQRSENPNTKAIADNLKEAAKVLQWMAPYRHARLSSIDHKFPELDLSRLTDAQLADLASLVSASSPESGGQNTPGAGTTTH